MTNNLSLERGLYTPTLPQADNNIIDLNLIDDYIIIQITNYINIGNYDKIIVRFNSIESNPFIVYFINNPPQYTFVKFYKNTLASGTYTVNYSSQDIALNIAYSDSIVVKIINGLTYNLPAPSFPKAENMSVYYNTIVADKGLIIRARYSDMHLGDKIIFKWNGMDSDGYDIPESTIELDPIVVSNKDLENNFVDGLIPQRNIQILGINGSGYGMYSRTSSINNKVKTDNSPKSHVYIVWENYNNLSMFISKKAAVRDSRYPYLLPSNKGAIFGQPGMMVD
ncbi:hypothetical protein [Pseudochrobactrum sp. MP213Fo]|uniref:hypothetical protein n=1 Tax=Pseudochrobactrum sp. MP213Fo TaxID=3022250 RepID=UPI003BA004B4